ncbi:Hypothetical predicted protein [Xyrichtys novacula]|uniref:GIY-YIG homing endonuclease n=1 Tax=Xyrichtys novacula TaxID=13765 RepID=A0AAV1GGE8_XYRNO|nr:Hypothetical predicted protein [Xyrichtys novacula]
MKPLFYCIYDKRCGTTIYLKNQSKIHYETYKQPCKYRTAALILIQKNKEKEIQQTELWKELRQEEGTTKTESKTSGR